MKTLIILIQSNANSFEQNLCLVINNLNKDILRNNNVWNNM